jgi:hypothetical protein
MTSDPFLGVYIDPDPFLSFPDQDAEGYVSDDDDEGWYRCDIAIDS